MSGFFSGYKPQVKNVQRPFGNLKLRKKLPMNEYTDNPPLRKSSYLTDDESGNEDEKLKTDSSNNTTNVDEELLNKAKEQEKENEQDDKENCGVADTVIDTVCTRISGINVNTNVKPTISESIFGSSLDDTVPDNSQVLKEIQVPLSSKKQLFSSSSSDSEDEQVEKMEESSGIIQILDSDEESLEVMQPPIFKTSDSFVNCSSSAATVNEFFNNIPSLPSHVGVTHSMIEKFKDGEQVVEEEAINESMEMSDKEMHVTFRKSRKTELSFDDNEHVEIGPTDESDLEDNNVVDLTLDDSGPKPAAKPMDDKKSKPKSQKTNSNPISVNIATQTPTQVSKKEKKKKKSVTNINIKFDLKISIREGSASSGSDHNSSSSSEEVEVSVQRSNLKAIAQSPFVERKSMTSDESTVKDENSGQEQEMGVIITEDSFHTPTRGKKEEKPVIDEELQSMLTDLYGETWKTPKVMSDFKIKKFREDLRKSIAANNFESFIGSLSKDLESTRISSPKSEKPIRKKPNENKFLKPTISNTSENNSLKKPISNKKLAQESPIPKVDTLDERENTNGSIRKVQSEIKVQKTPMIIKNTQTVPKTPLHLICDPDTSSESEDASDDDDDFNPNDTWNASSDEDYESEKDRIKKRQSVKHNELIFTLDDSLNEILKKYEFQPPPQIDTKSTEKPARRKLFTHTHFDDDENVEKEPKKDEKKTPLKDSWNVPKATPATDSKIPKILKKTPSSQPKSSTKSTPKSVHIDNAISKNLLKQFSKYSFLKSLDAEANKMLCDAEALVYRENYKSKKNDLAGKLFKLYNEKVFNSQLTDVPVQWNKKLLTTGGRCNNSRRNGIRNSLIELSDKVLTSADRLRCTLIHEMCHAASWKLNGENGHGSTWKKWTAKANSVFPELPKITVCHNYVIEYKYTYLCMTCHARSQAHTKNKKVEEIRCSLCKGSIQLFENKKDAQGKLELVPVQKKEPTAFAKFVKLKFKEVKQPGLSQKEVMQMLSAQFSSLSVEERAQL